MSDSFYQKIYELSSKSEIFAVATVIRTEGSTSGKPGHKMIIGKDGQILSGTIGGGCIESQTVEEALVCMKTGQTKILSMKLVDELGLEPGSVDMPCGGTMHIYIEPHLPKPQLLIIGSGHIAKALSKLGHIMGFHVTVDDLLASKEAFPDADLIITDDPDLREVSITGQTYVTITTRHKYDERALKRVLQFDPVYVSLVASSNRTQIIFGNLIKQGVSRSKLETVRAPAGLDIGAYTPEEIALSIMAEIVKTRRGGTGKSLREVKQYMKLGRALTVEQGRRSVDESISLEENHQC